MGTAQRNSRLCLLSATPKKPETPSIECVHKLGKEESILMYSQTLIRDMMIPSWTSMPLETHSSTRILVHLEELWKATTFRTFTTIKLRMVNCMVSLPSKNATSIPSCAASVAIVSQTTEMEIVPLRTVSMLIQLTIRTCVIPTTTTHPFLVLPRVIFIVTAWLGPMLIRSLLRCSSTTISSTFPF